jgi:hypothetical protein
MGSLRKALRKLDPFKKGIVNPLGGVLQKQARKVGDPFSEKNTPASLRRAERKFGWASPGVSTRRVMGTLSSGKGLFHRNLKGNLAKTREAHAIQEDQSGNTAKAFADAEAKMKSGDPAVRAQGIADYNFQSKDAHKLALKHGKQAVKAGLMAESLVSGYGAMTGGETAAGGGAAAGGVTTAADEANLANQLDAAQQTAQAAQNAKNVSQTSNWLKTAGGALKTAAPYVGVAAGVLAKKGGKDGTGGAASGQIGQISAQEQAVGNQLLQDYQNGKLQPADQAAIDQFKTQSRSQMNQYLSNAGISDSTMAQEEMAKIDQNAMIMYGKFRSQTLTAGLAALNPAMTGFSILANQQIKANTDLTNAWATGSSAFMQLLAAAATSSSTTTG